ncbi:VWA domain-containing protein [Mycobacterium sp. MYCO198283]|uniref:VWA domain-containing protein n=1 Tax=Mycobacterium sp. MYCO198283 TaxID=2883505 RepID=UPI001E5D0110|nr:VWA domain-containing protein [Mycobacterium sp. MYCO198283]MCG5433995.1 VWA domain-containing protein [Mycobacterium sp. MYCO198283]
MTFAPVIPPIVLLMIGAALLLLRLLSLMRARRRTRATLLRWAALTAALLLLVLAAARPVLGAAPQQAAGGGETSDVNVFLVVDRSVDTTVPDVDGAPRFDAIRADVAALVQRYPRARIAIIGFASRPSLDWPLSQDVWSLGPELDALAPYPAAPDAAQQVNAAAAATVLRYQLIAAAQQYPGAQNLVFYLGSGAGGSQAPQGEFSVTSVDGGAVLGYGTAAGALVDQPGPSVVSGRNEPALRAIAGQLGVPYVQRDGGPLADALPGDDPGAAATGPQQPAGLAPEPAESTELYWLAAALAAALLLVEIFLTVREFRRSRLVRKEVER